MNSLRSPLIFRCVLIWYLQNGVHIRYVFFYYSNLPDLSSRILFYGKVLESDYSINKDNNISIYDKTLPGEKYMKLKLRSICLDKDTDKFN